MQAALPHITCAALRGLTIQCRPGYLLNAGVAVDSFAVAVIGCFPCRKELIINSSNKQGSRHLCFSLELDNFGTRRICLSVLVGIICGSSSGWVRGVDIYVLPVGRFVLIVLTWMDLLLA
jgi:hypothetical protein